MRDSRPALANGWARDRLRELLTLRGITGAELARRLGEPPMWVSDRIRGHSAISADDLPRIAAALDIDVRDFIPTDGAASAEGSPRPDLEPSFERALPFAREMAAAWPALHAREQRLVEAVARAAAAAAANAVLTVLRKDPSPE